MKSKITTISNITIIYLLKIPFPLKSIKIMAYILILINIYTYKYATIKKTAKNSSTKSKNTWITILHRQSLPHPLKKLLLILPHIHLKNHSIIKFFRYKTIQYIHLIFFQKLKELISFIFLFRKIFLYIYINLNLDL